MVHDAPEGSAFSADPSIRFLFTGGNAGFARACNLGASSAHPDFILFANDDLEFSSPFLPDLLEALERNATLAAVVPPIHLRSSTGTLIDESFTNLRFQLGLFYPESGEALAPTSEQPQIIPLKWVTAACLLLRRSAFDAIGGFDPAYSPAYCEDLDLSFRLRLAGWTLGRVATSPVFHRRGETTTQLGAEAIRSLFLRNLLIFHFKFFRRGPLAWTFRAGLQARLISPRGPVWRRARDEALAILKNSKLPPPVVSSARLWRLLFTTQ